MVTTTSTRFKVKVNTSKGSSYWTLSGSTANIDLAVIFTKETVPDFFKQSLEQDYIELIPVE